MSFIKVENLTMKYGSGESIVKALDDINLEIDAGDFVSIMGESGAGKSTLLASLGAMTTPTAGSITAADIDIYSLKQEQQADFRREFIGFVFQSFHLMSYLTVRENVLLPLVNTNMSRHVKRNKADEALKRVGLDYKGGRLPNQLSGGEQERVALARALVNNPPILLADEPTGNLDSKTSCRVMEFLQDLNRTGMTIIMVTHSSESNSYAGRHVTLSDGSMIGDDVNAFEPKRV